MVISSKQKLNYLNEYTMNIHIDSVPINQSNQSKSLGIIIDENLSWKALLYSEGDRCPIRWTKVTEALGTRLHCTHTVVKHLSMGEELREDRFVQS